MKKRDPEALKGAIEGDRPGDPQQFNPNAGALDEQGLPAKMLPICEDVIGANVDNDERMKGAAGAAVRSDEVGRAPTDDKKP